LGPYRYQVLVSDPGKVTPPPTLATGTGALLVKKIVECNKTIIVDGCETAKFTIKVTMLPAPSEFTLGNGDTQLVTFGATSDYEVSEPELDGFTAKFSGDCRLGIIEPGDHKTCTITNTEEG
jgi:hypothetical protein